MQIDCATLPLHATHLCVCLCAYLLQHAGSELHGLMVLLLQHVHVEVIQEVVPVIIHPALVQLRRSGERRRLIRYIRIFKSKVLLKKMEH